MKKAMEKSIPTIHQAIATIIDIKFGEEGAALSERAYRVRDLDALQKLLGKLKDAHSLADAEKIFDAVQ
jgi:hypothetical protein